MPTPINYMDILRQIEKHLAAIEQALCASTVTSDTGKRYRKAVTVGVNGAKTDFQLKDR